MKVLMPPGLIVSGQLFFANRGNLTVSLVVFTVLLVILTVILIICCIRR